MTWTAFLLLLLASGPAVQPRSAAAIELRGVANAGVLLTIDGQKILVDAPIRDGIRPYTAPAADERERLEGARAPYDGVAAVLVTHWHEDHFSAEAVAALLRSSSQTVLISSQEVVDRVRAVAPDLPPARFRPATPAPGASAVVELGPLRVRVLRLRHNPTRRLPEQHVGFLIEGTRTVLHVGDADPGAENFAVLRGLRAVDLALVPFWFLTDASTAASTVTGAIKPRHIAGLHLPSADADATARALAARGLRATLLRSPGEMFSFD